MNIIKNGLKLSGSIIAACIISFFLCISINVICTSVFTDFIGYNAYVYTKDGQEPIDEYQYLYTDKDGDGKDDLTDTKKVEYEKAGYTVTTYKVRSVLEGSNKSIFLVLTQILNSILIISFASGSVYKLGFKDANLARTGHIKTDNFKGFKIGAIAYAPFFALFIILFVFIGLVPNFRMVWYAFLNSHFYSIIVWISGGADVASKLNALQLILLFLIQLIVPIISGIAYILGFKEINISDKLVYKKGEI